MWNAWNAPPGARTSDYAAWDLDEAHCATCGELPPDCHCQDEEDEDDTHDINDRPRGTLQRHGRGTAEAVAG